MFREMRRSKQQISDDECRQLLHKAKRGVLSVNGDDGYPYGVPIDFVYDEENGRICFHGAKSGHKIDAIRRSDKATLCVMDEGTSENGSWMLRFKSVIVFGRIKPADEAEYRDICSAIAHKFTSDEDYITKELRSLPAVQCLELKIEHMSGKTVLES